MNKVPTHTPSPATKASSKAGEAAIVKLVPFEECDFQSWFDHCTEEYAKDKQKTFGCSLEAARAFAQSSMQQALPDKLQTSNNHLFMVTDLKGNRVGTIWFAVQSQFDQKSAFIYDIEIEETMRGRGYGRAAMQALEDVATGMSLSSIGLHVFAFNERALALYRSQDFEVTDYTMRKKIQPQN
nr:GNAT family N-acetyltransferase [uncultured Cohaesibacter sp.]